MNRIIEITLKRYRLIIIAVALLTIPFVYYSSHHRFFNNIDIFFDREDPALQYYKRFQRIYGNEEMAVIVFTQKKLFTNENLRIIRDMTETIKKSPGISRVFSLTEHKKTTSKDDTIYYKRLVPPGLLTENEINTVKQKALSDNVVVKNLVSPDGSTTSILMELNVIRDNEKKRNILMEIMKDVKRIAASKKAGEPIELHFAGVPYVEVEMNYLSERDFFTFIPIIFTIIFLVVFSLLRNIKLTILCQTNLFLSLLWAVGFFVLCGETFNMATIVMGPVVLAISVADSIHLLTHYRKLYFEKNLTSLESVKNAAGSVWLPCLLTSLTTGVGFFSFITSSIRPVKVLGVFTGSGVMFAFVLTILFLPAALMLFQRRREDFNIHASPELQQQQNFLLALLERLGKTVTAHHRIVALFLVVIMGLSVAGMRKIRFETNFMNYLPSNSPIREDINYIEKNMGGTIPFVMLLHAGDQAHAFNTPAGLKAIDRVQKDIMNNVPQFSTSFSIADYMREINQAFNSNRPEFHRLPKNKADILDYFEIGDLEVMERLISPDMMEARISFQSKWDSNETANIVNSFITTYMEKNLGRNYTYRITGLSAMYLNMEYNLKQSQRTSFALAFAIILVMMYLVCKNIKLTIISMLVNLFPIAVTLGIMGWFAIPMDVSTVMIASVTIGIAVDDTIHFITWFRRNREHGLDTDTALQHSYRDVGRPIVITSVVLFLGFFILIMGTIKPTRAFGVLTAFAMIFALVGDLVALPALIMLLKSKNKE